MLFFVWEGILVSSNRDVLIEAERRYSHKTKDNIEKFINTLVREFYLVVLKEEKGEFLVDRRLGLPP